MKTGITLKKPKMVSLSFYVGILLLVLGCVTFIHASKIQITTTKIDEKVVNHLVTTSEVNQERHVYYMGMHWVLPDSKSAFLPIANYRKSEPGLSKDINRNLFYIESSDKFLDRTVTTTTDSAKKVEKTWKVCIAIVFIIVGLCLSYISASSKSKRSWFLIPA